MNECNNNMFGLMDIKLFAKEIGTKESTVRTWKSRGDIPEECFVKIGGRIFIKTEKFKEYIDRTS